MDSMSVELDTERRRADEVNRKLESTSLRCTDLEVQLGEIEQKLARKKVQHLARLERNALAVEEFCGTLQCWRQPLWFCVRSRVVTQVMLQST